MEAGIEGKKVREPDVNSGRRKVTKKKGTKKTRKTPTENAV